MSLLILRKCKAANVLKICLCLQMTGDRSWNSECWEALEITCPDANYKLERPGSVGPTVSCLGCRGKGYVLHRTPYDLHYLRYHLQ